MLSFGLSNTKPLTIARARYGEELGLVYGPKTLRMTLIFERDYVWM